MAKTSHPMLCILILCRAESCQWERQEPDLSPFSHCSSYSPSCLIPSMILKKWSSSHCCFTSAQPYNTPIGYLSANRYEPLRAFACTYAGFSHALSLETGYQHSAETGTQRACRILAWANLLSLFGNGVVYIWSPCSSRALRVYHSPSSLILCIQACKG